MNWISSLNRKLCSIILIAITVIAIQLFYVASTYADASNTATTSELQAKTTIKKHWSHKMSPDVIKTKLQAAVTAGKITPEQADLKLEAITAKFTKKTKKNRGFHKMSPDVIKTKLRAAVTAGKITPEQADLKLEAITAKFTKK